MIDYGRIIKETMPHIKMILFFSLLVFFCSFSFISAQEFEDTLFQEELEDTVQIDSTQQKLDELFARASSGVVEHKELADSAKKKLVDMGEVAVPYLTGKLGSRDVRDVITSIDILKKIGSSAVPHLIESLADTNKDKVRLAIRVLGEMKDTTAVMPLVDMLNDEDFRIRGGTATALGEIGDSLAADYLIPVLNDTANLVRKSAAFALGETGSPRAIPYLINTLSDEYYGTRFAASNSLVKFGNIATKPLIPLLNADDPKYRCLVIETLGKIEDKEALKPLLQNLNDTDWVVRGFTVEALGNLGVDKGIKAIKELEKTEEHPYVKRKIGEALEKISQ